MATQAAKLQTYIWVGKDRAGKVAKGEMQVSRIRRRLKAQLTQAGHCRLKQLSVKPKSLFGPSKKAIQVPPILRCLPANLATMMKAGVPLVQAFDIVAEGLDNPYDERARLSASKMKLHRVPASRCR